MRTDRVHGEKCQRSHLGNLHLSIAGAISSCHMQRGNQAKKVQIPRDRKQCTWTFLNSCRSELGPRTWWLCFSRPISHSKPSRTLLFSSFYFFIFFLSLFLFSSFSGCCAPYFSSTETQPDKYMYYWFTFCAIIWHWSLKSPFWHWGKAPRFSFLAK